MRSIAVEMHMRTDHLNRYKAMGALFVKAVVKKVRLFKRPQSMIGIGADLISMFIPGGNMLDLKSILKFLKFLVAEQLGAYSKYKQPDRQTTDYLFASPLVCSTNMQHTAAGHFSAECGMHPYMEYISPAVYLNGHCVLTNINTKTPTNETTNSYNDHAIDDAVCIMSEEHDTRQRRNDNPDKNCHKLYICTGKWQYPDAYN